MKIKIRPKCHTINDGCFNACKRCYADLENVTCEDCTQEEIDRIKEMNADELQKQTESGRVNQSGEKSSEKKSFFEGEDFATADEAHEQVKRLSLYLKIGLGSLIASLPWTIVMGGFAGLWAMDAGRVPDAVAMIIVALGIAATIAAAFTVHLIRYFLKVESILLRIGTVLGLSLPGLTFIIAGLGVCLGASALLFTPSIYILIGLIGTYKEKKDAEEFLSLLSEA